MPGTRHCSFDDVKCKQCKIYAISLFYLHFYVKRVEIVIWNIICDKQIITWGFGYRPQYQN